MNKSFASIAVLNFLIFLMCSPIGFFAFVFATIGLGGFWIAFFDMLSPVGFFAFVFSIIGISRLGRLIFPNVVPIEFSALVLLAIGLDRFYVDRGFASIKGLYR